MKKKTHTNHGLLFRSICESAPMGKQQGSKPCQPHMHSEGQGTAQWQNICLASSGIGFHPQHHKESKQEERKQGKEEERRKLAQWINNHFTKFEASICDSGLVWGYDSNRIKASQVYCHFTSVKPMPWTLQLRSFAGPRMGLQLTLWLKVWPSVVIVRKKGRQMAIRFF